MAMNKLFTIDFKHFYKNINFYLAMIGIVISLLIGYVIYSYETKVIELNFSRDIDLKVATLERELLVRVEVLFALQAFYDNSVTVTYDEFQNFTKVFIKRHPGIKALEWAPKVTHEQRLVEKYKSYRVDHPFIISEKSSPGQIIKANHRSLYFPVYFITPFIGNELAYGFDIISEPARKKTLFEAIETDSAVVSEPLRLVRGDSHSKEFLVFIPVYDTNKDNFIEKLKQIKGMIIGVFDIADIFKASLKKNKEIEMSIQLFDVTNEQSYLLYEEPKTVNDLQNNILNYNKMLIPLYSRQWKIIASPSLAYFAKRRTWMPYVSILLSLLVCVFLIEYIYHISRRNLELMDIRQQLEALVVTDALTGVYNKRYFNKNSEIEWRRAIRQHTALGLLMIDIDHFKLFNDTYGHQLGDVCLSNVAKIIMKTASRMTDFVCRYGGEEFTVILPDTDNVLVIAEECRLAVEALCILNEKSTVCEHITISVGAVKITPTDYYSLYEFINLADKALYQAKEKGRNQVVYYDRIKELKN